MDFKILYILGFLFLANLASCQSLNDHCYETPTASVYADLSCDHIYVTIWNIDPKGKGIERVGVSWSDSSRPTVDSSPTVSVYTSAGKGNSYFMDNDFVGDGAISAETTYRYIWFIETSDGVITERIGTAQQESPACGGSYAPIVETYEPINITESSGTVTGSVLDNGGESIIEQGTTWNLTGSPTTGDNISVSGVITGVSPNTKVYARYYAINSEGTGYGQQKTFTTDVEPPDLPIYGGNGGLEVASGLDEIDINYPASIQAGNVLVCNVWKVYLSSTESYIIPSGWTAVSTNNSEDLAYGTYVKIASGTESGTLTITAMSGTEAPLFVGVIHKYTNATGYSSVGSTSVSSSDGTSGSGNVSGNVIKCIYHLFDWDQTVTFSGDMDLDSNLSDSFGNGTRGTAQSKNGNYSYDWSTPLSKTMTSVFINITND
jgi:hypothetical protein